MNDIPTYSLAVTFSLKMNAVIIRVNINSTCPKDFTSAGFTSVMAVNQPTDPNALVRPTNQASPSLWRNKLNCTRSFIAQ